jgi:hypothetical protein
MSAASLAHDVESLFKLPLDEFTSARNALAGRLKKDGHAAEAKEAKALTKPSASAWVVNQLFWRHREVFDRLIETGERLRHAHAAGDDARDAANARRKVLAELTAIATDLLRDGNHGATRDLLRRVTTTLEALSSYGSAAGAQAAGRLVDDLEPPGFQAVAGLLPASGKRAAGGGQIRMPSARPTAKGSSAAPRTATVAKRDTDERKRLIAAAKSAVRDAERAFDAARMNAEQAATQRDTAAARAKAIDSKCAELEMRLARAAKDAAAARAAADESAARLDEATAAAESAERALDAARERLREATADEG